MIIWVKPQNMWPYIEQHEIQVVVNPCNCVGVSGRGISQQVMSRWPELEPGYKKACREGLRPGMLALHWANDNMGVLHFPTKDHWRNSSQYSYIEDGLDKLVLHWDRLMIESIFIPPLGCGLGRLEWQVVRGLIEDRMDHLPENVHVLEQR
jgi:O-acetyl-ADP-ribose deacetylase (regulator of RNase III)